MQSPWQRARGVDVEVEGKLPAKQNAEQRLDVVALVRIGNITLGPRFHRTAALTVETRVPQPIQKEITVHDSDGRCLIPS